MAASISREADAVLRALNRTESPSASSLPSAL